MTATARRIRTLMIMMTMMMTTTMTKPLGPSIEGLD